MNLEIKLAQKPLWRIGGRPPDPWKPADWAYAREDGSFGDRFDDPQGLYRLLYVSSQRLGCYVETLARFRPDLSLLQELKDISGENDFYPIGTVHLDWLDERLIGSARVEGSFADSYASGWISELRHRLGHKPWHWAFRILT